MSPKKPVVYTLDMSPPGRCVLLTAAALGLSVDVKEVDFFNQEHLSPTYIKMNPQHTVPVLEDNGFYVWDSHAIATYLVNQYGPKDCSLYPSCPKKRALIDQRLHFDSGILFARLRFLLGPLIYDGAKSFDLGATMKIFEAYDFLEAFLSQSTWLVGDNVTLADLSCSSTVTSLETVVPIRKEKYPLVQAWLERCKGLPYYQKINQVGVEAFHTMIFPKKN